MDGRIDQPRERSGRRSSGGAAKRVPGSGGREDVDVLGHRNSGKSAARAEAGGGPERLMVGY